MAAFEILIGGLRRAEQQVEKQLRSIRDAIQSLQAGTADAGAPRRGRPAGTAKRGPGRPRKTGGRKKRRKMSAAGRRKISQAQKKRWAEKKKKKPLE